MPRTKNKAELAHLAALVEQKIDAAESALNTAHDALGELMDQLNPCLSSSRTPLNR